MKMDIKRMENGYKTHQNEEENPLFVPERNDHAHIQYSTFVNDHLEDGSNHLTECYTYYNESSNSIDNSTTECKDKEEEFKSGKFTRRQYFMIFLLSYGIFWISCCYSLIAPFFPQEAKRKGMTATVYGFVFGVFQFVVFFTSPIFGRIVSTVTPRFFAIYGMLISGCCSILFGVISMSPDGKPFIILAFAVRIVEALGTSAYYVGALTIGVEEFPNNRGFISSLIESMAGIGMIIGPTVGGFLYEAGGYILPFITLGGFILLGFIIAPFVIKATVLTENPPSPGIWLLLKHPRFYIHLSIFIYGLMLVGFNEATLGNHLEQFHLKPSITGLVFSVPALMYAVGTPFWGCIADKIDKKVILCLIGISFSSIAFLLIGPLPFLNISTRFWLIIVALTILGIGIGGTLLPCFLLCLSDTLQIGYPDNISTYGLITGIYSSTTAFGAFIGPSIGGVMIDTIGYIKATLVLFFISLFMMAIMIFYSISSLQCRCRNGERDSVQS